jgi:hypothetical protein
MGKQSRLREQRRVERGGLTTAQLHARRVGGTWRDFGRITHIVIDEVVDDGAGAMAEFAAMPSYLTDVRRPGRP